MLSGTRSVVAALVLVVAASAAYGELVDSPFTWIYVAITVVLALVIGLIHRAVRFPPRVLWGLVGAAAGNLAGGILLVSGQPLYVYDLVGGMRYDKPYHFVATGVAAWAAYEVLAARMPGATRLGVGFLAVMVAAGAGALVEIVEYAGTIVIDNANVGDYDNNMLDLVANLLGAVLAAWITALRIDPSMVGSRPGPRSHHQPLNRSS